jgi:hypothetical protein
MGKGHGGSGQRGGSGGTRMTWSAAGRIANAARSNPSSASAQSGFVGRAVSAASSNQGGGQSSSQSGLGK